MKIKMTSLLNALVGLYAIIGSIAFFLIQTGKLCRPESTEKEMLNSPMGMFDWGFIWADTVVAGPFLLIGGIFLFLRSQILQKIGNLLVFSGFAINLYAMITLWIGLWKIGQSMAPGQFWMDLILTVFGILGMVFIAFKKDC